MKTVRLILAPLLALALLCSCARTQRFGVWELERRLCEADTKYAFDTETMFRKEGVYHIFYRTENGTLLLKAKEDEKQRLTELSLTVQQTDADAAGAFSALACAVTDVFLPPNARADARAALRLSDPATFFRDETLTAEWGRYNGVFFKTTQGASLMLRYESPDVTASARS